MFYSQYFVIWGLLFMALAYDDHSEEASVYGVKQYDPEEYPKPNLPFIWESKCSEPVVIFHMGMGEDYFLARMENGEKLHVQHNFGQLFYAALDRPELPLLGEFRASFNASLPPALGSGSSTQFVILCESKLRDLDQLKDCQGEDCDIVVEYRLPRTASAMTHPWPARQHNERVRVQMSERQRVEVEHFTERGFSDPIPITKVSPEGWEALLQFYNTNKDTPNEIVEGWSQENTYVNHWESPTTMIHIPYWIKEILWRDLTPVLAEWASVDPESLVGSSIYGVRRYWNGSLLSNHVDRGDELVLSAILNVDQSPDAKEPWALQIYDHELQPYHVTMKPGDLVLYESAAAIHGRPFPLTGTYYANCFCHLKPRTWSYKMNRYG